MDKFKLWIILFFATQSLYALTTCNVTLSSDNDPGGIGDVGDFRYCLNTMNNNLNTTPDDYAIVFASPMTIQLNGILPVINNSVNPVNITIGNSNPSSIVTLDGNSGAYSGLFIPTGNVTIQNMNLQNLTARGGNGGNGISGGAGGMGAGGGIYAPQLFLNGSNPSITLKNVSINNCSAVGGNGGNHLGVSATGDEGGGGGGGFSGNGGSIIISASPGSTGGAGGGGFGGDGGDVTLSINDVFGGGGGGGGGFGSRATLGILTNLGNGGSDQNPGLDGNGYGLNITAGSGGGGILGGNNAGGGGGGASTGVSSGGGGGGSAGTDGIPPFGSIPPLADKLSKGKRINILKNIASLSKEKRKHNKAAQPSGGIGGDGAGGGGGGVVTVAISNNVDGQSGGGGYAGGGGGGAGTGAYDTDYTVQGGTGGVGGGGGGGGVNQSGATPADGGNSLGGGGGGGGGPSNGLTASGGTDIGNLGGGSGGVGANNYGSGFGGGGGGGGSGLGGAIFVDSNLNFTVEALSGVPTTFNTPSNTTQAGIHGTGGAGGSDGLDGSALGNSIFLRTGSTLTLLAQNTNDLLTIGDQVSFTDDTIFGAGGTSVDVKGNGTVVYNGTTDYQGTVRINNATLKVNGQIDTAPIFVCRNISFSTQRGTLSGIGILTGNIFANSGTISPDIGGTLTLGSLSLNSAASGSLGSLIHININSSGTSLVAVTGPATLAGILEINLDASAQPGRYIVLTSSGITGTFDSVRFNGTTPKYTLSYLPVGAPTFVQLEIFANPPPPASIDIPATVNGSAIFNPAVVCCGRPVLLGPLPVPGLGPTIYTISEKTGNVTCNIVKTDTQTFLKMYGNNGSCTIVGTKDGITSNPFKVIAP